MDIQQLREQFAAELRRQRLPRAYIERLLGEWDDHITDLQEERDATMHQARKPEALPTDSAIDESHANDIIDLQVRIGDPTALATFAAKQYHSRSFLGRHPILTFLVLPVPIVLLQLVGVMCLLFVPYLLESYCGIDILQGLKEQDHPVLGSVLLGFFSCVILVAPPLAAGLLLCRIARKNVLNWRWSAAACALISIYCGVFFLSWRLATAHDNGIFMLGVSFPWSARWILLVFLPKVAVAMGIGSLLVWRSEQLREQSNGDNSTAVRRRAA